MDQKRIEELSAQLADKDCLIQQQADEIERLRRDVKKQQEKMIKLAQKLPKRGRWVDGDARRVTARCSVCGHLRLGNGAEWANKHVHFCEVCGSRMGGRKAALAYKSGWKRRFQNKDESRLDEYTSNVGAVD